MRAYVVAIWLSFMLWIFVAHAGGVMVGQWYAQALANLPK